mgnify:CR=1 FL=1
MSKRIGAQTTALPSCPGLIGWAGIAGQKEKEGPYGAKFDWIIPDELNGEQSFEGAERAMLEQAVVLCAEKAGTRLNEIQMLLAGDLLNQIISAGFAARNLGIPFYGLYGACSTMSESLSVGGMLADGGFADRLICATCSHFCTAERQYRAPLELGNQRTPTAQWTVTGAGAVMTETISQEVYPRLPQTCYHEGGAVFSTSLYSNLTLEQWEVELEKLHPGDCKVIASIRGATPSELAYVARKAERMGVDALQLDLYAPIGPVLAELYTSPDLIAALVSAVKKKVSLPLMVRLPHYVADNKKSLRALETAGADGICTIESIRGISGVDIVNARPLMPTHGGYTGTNVRPITLSAIAALSQNSNLPVAATGGFDAAENVIEAIELGATTVMLGSALLGGYGIITETVRRLEEWLDKNGYLDIGALRGAALQYLRSYEELHER